MEDGEEKKGGTQSQTSRINETVTLISVPEEGPNTAWCGLEQMGFLRDLLNKSHLSGVLVYIASTKILPVFQDKLLGQTASIAPSDGKTFLCHSLSQQPLMFNSI